MRIRQYHQPRKQSGGGGGGGWAAAAQAASGIASGFIANAGNARRQKKAFKQGEKMMGIQFENQQALNQQGADLQYEMWKKTNAPEQMKMLEEAGLNPGLIYGGSGAGGQTTAGSQGGGAASGGSVPGTPPMIPMDIGNAVSIAADLAEKKARTRDINAAAEEKEINNQYEREIRAREETARFTKSKAALDHENITHTKFNEKDPNDNQSEYQKGEIASYQQKIENLNKTKSEINLQELVAQGQISENAVKNYKAELARAKIDPDSNPLVREMMKAMASEGVPVAEILRKIVRFFIN